MSHPPAILNAIVNAVSLTTLADTGFVPTIVSGLHRETAGTGGGANLRDGLPWPKDRDASATRSIFSHNPVRKAIQSSNSKKLFTYPTPSTKEKEPKRKSYDRDFLATQYPRNEHTRTVGTREKEPTHSVGSASRCPEQTWLV